MLLATLFNLITDLVGGMRFTVLEEEVVEAKRVIMGIDGVRSVHMLRTRRHGAEASADVHVQVAPRLSVSEGHMISQAVEDRLIEKVESITDVTVHIDPEDDEHASPCTQLPLRDEILRRLQREVFVLSVEDELDDAPTLAGFETRLRDDGELEIEKGPGTDMNDLFAELDARGIRVASLRNRANRLEEMFMHLVERKGGE